jgi:hypothetical protein
LREIGVKYNTTSRVDIYDLAGNIWSNSTLSGPRAYISAVSLDDKIYFAGGHSEDRWYAAPSAAIDIYDLKSNSWSVSSLNTHMGFLAGIGFGGKIYWTEGCVVEIKDLSTGNSSTGNLFKPASWFNSQNQPPIVKDKKIVFYNGAGSDQERENKFDIYDPVANTWSIGVLTQNLWGFSIISVNNIIYIAGGYLNGSISDQVWMLEF